MKEKRYTVTEKEVAVIEHCLRYSTPYNATRAALDAIERIRSRQLTDVLKRSIKKEKKA